MDLFFVLVVSKIKVIEPAIVVHTNSHLHFSFLSQYGAVNVASVAFVFPHFRSAALMMCFGTFRTTAFRRSDFLC